MTMACLSRFAYASSLSGILMRPCLSGTSSEAEASRRRRSSRTLAFVIDWRPSLPMIFSQVAFGYRSKYLASSPLVSTRPSVRYARYFAGIVRRPLSSILCSNSP